MEAQLQRRQIRANYSLAIAAALAVALVTGAGLGYQIGSALPAKTVDIVPGSGDDLASDITPAHMRDDWPFVQERNSTTLHEGVQTSHMEQSESVAPTDDLTVDFPTFWRGPQ